MGDMDNYMYGDFASDVAELENTVAATDRFTEIPGPENQSYIREQLIYSTLPLFKGDSVDGLIKYCRQLEAYIANG